ncbi:MAG: MFS transporter [Polyangiaceae bacterium]|nr:MFS transporter [Polyangiaceae bacterium]MCL4748922.1 MFS transporter [Myxococcales bacterium]
MARLPRTVIVLGLASLLTDLSSDMIYPLLPAYLAVTLGAGALGLGAMEGAAEATASLLKIASGRLADYFPKRKPLVVAGYSLSGLTRPLIGLALIWPLVIALRLLDRVGKGLRTAPRDALIADQTPPELRGRAFGLHRAMDNAGAVLGPLAAAGLLALGFSTREVFLWAALPGLLVVLVLAFGVREARRELPSAGTIAAAGGALGSPFRRVLFAVALFTLGNSSDMFLLLYLGHAGMGAPTIALVWAAHNVVRTVAVLLGGPIADRFDKRRLLMAGWLLYALTYAALTLTTSRFGIALLLIAYALYFGFVEPTERALVAELAPSTRRGAAFGWFHGVVGLTALPASALAGLVWWRVGPRATFALGAALAVVALGVLALLSPPRPVSRAAPSGG